MNTFAVVVERSAPLVNDVISAGRDHIALWQQLRLLAFLDVASFHLTQRHGLYGIGLPIFLILTFALGIRRPTPAPTGRFIRARLRRLIVPWVVWSLAFAALYVVQALHHRRSVAGVFEARMLLYGTEPLLWFLPTAAIGSVVTHLLDRATRQAHTPVLLAGCFAGAGLLLGLQHALALEFPFGQWLFAAPAVPLALAVGRLLALSSSFGRRRRAWIALFVGCGMVAALALLVRALLMGIDPEPTGRYGLAMTLLGLGALVRNVADPWTPRLTPLLFGAYILHKVVYDEITCHLARAAHVTLTPFGIVLVTVPLTLIVVALLRRTLAHRVL